MFCQRVAGGKWYKYLVVIEYNGNILTGMLVLWWIRRADRCRHCSKTYRTLPADTDRLTHCFSLYLQVLVFNFMKFRLGHFGTFLYSLNVCLDVGLGVTLILVKFDTDCLANLFLALHSYTPLSFGSADLIVSSDLFL